MSLCRVAPFSLPARREVVPRYVVVVEALSSVSPFLLDVSAESDNFSLSLLHGVGPFEVLGVPGNVGLACWDAGCTEPVNSRMAALLLKEGVEPERPVCGRVVVSCMDGMEACLSPRFDVDDWHMLLFKTPRVCENNTSYRTASRPCTTCTTCAAAVFVHKLCMCVCVHVRACVCTCVPVVCGGVVCTCECALMTPSSASREAWYRSRGQVEAFLPDWLPLDAFTLRVLAQWSKDLVEAEQREQRWATAYKFAPQAVSDYRKSKRRRRSIVQL
jgi:hypothetical protein